jgi:hypothetical protein
MAAIHEVLTNVGFNATTRGVLVNADIENLNLAALYTWTDENVDDLVCTLCKIPPNAAGALPYVPVRAIDRMKTVTYVYRHMIRTQRVLTIGFFTSVRILSNWTQERKSKADYKEPDETPSKLPKPNNATILECTAAFVSSTKPTEQILTDWLLSGLVKTAPLAAASWVSVSLVKINPQMVGLPVLPCPVP